MKVLILGFDGMEYNLAEKWKLKNLLQVQYGKLKIPKECYKKAIDPFGNIIYEPWTPFVWASILTGKLPAEIELSEASIQKWQNVFIQTLRSISLKLGLTKNRLTRRLMDGRGQSLEKLGFRKNQFDLIKEKRINTIFHKATKPVAINVPLIQGLRNSEEDSWSLKLKGKNIEEMTDEAWKNFRRIKRRTLETIEKSKDWDLMMSYVRFLDTIGELHYGSFISMHKAYMACNRYAGQAQQLIDEKSVCLVISDHGMQPMNGTRFGKHSEYAFYSLNINTEWKPKVITDIFAKIPELLNK